MFCGVGTVLQIYDLKETYHNYNSLFTNLMLNFLIFNTFITFLYMFRAL